VVYLSITFDAYGNRPLHKKRASDIAIPVRSP
jgi:hypothetical protein